MPRIEKEIVIKNKQGLHARPAAVFVQIAIKYDSEVILRKGEESVNGKSIMGILTLGAESGTPVTLIVDGPDAVEAAVELEAFLSHDG